jgi:hypothetical protein
VLRREGEYWTIAHGAHLVRLRHSRGLGYLELLLREPGRAFPVLELAASQTAPRATTSGAARDERTRVAVTKAIRATLRKLAIHDPVLGDLLDRSVRTGATCAYLPVVGLPQSWQG